MHGGGSSTKVLTSNVMAAITKQISVIRLDLECLPILCPMRSSSQFWIYRCQVELSTDILFQFICMNVISVMLASFGNNFV